jgi:hypothetical protein
MMLLAGFLGATGACGDGAAARRDGERTGPEPWDGGAGAPRQETDAAPDDLGRPGERGTLICGGTAIGDAQGEVVEGSGVVTERAFPLADFRRVTVGFCRVRAEIRRSDAFSVRALLDDNLIDYLLVEVRGEELVIRLRPEGGVLLAPAEEPVVRIDMPTLVAATATVGSGVTASGFAGLQGLTGSASSGGYLEMSDGAIGAAELVASSGGSIDLAQIAIQDATITASTGAAVSVRVDGTLDASASTGATITYNGAPTLGAINESTGGTVRPE